MHDSYPVPPQVSVYGMDTPFEEDLITRGKQDLPVPARSTLTDFGEFVNIDRITRSDK